MSKKLFVFILVACCTSAANGALTLNIVDQDTISLDGIIDADIYVIVTCYGGILSPLDDAALGPAAPTLSGYFGPASDWEGMGLFPSGWNGGVWTLNSAPGEAYVTGNYLTLDVAYTGMAYLYCSWYNEVTGESGIIYEPEPMTIGLLALGGLFLLRRRK
jgi:hypothetical protein